MCVVREDILVREEPFTVHPKLTDPALRRKIKASLREHCVQYVEPNSRDNYRLVAANRVYDELMQVVLTMTKRELSRDFWWEDGFIVSHMDEFFRRPRLDKHKGLWRLANDIAGEVYDETKRKDDR